MKILIATDGSEFSKEAIKKACALFRGSHDVKIMIVSAFETPGPIAAEPYMGVAAEYQDVTDYVKQRSEIFADSACEMVKAELPQAEITSSVKMGTPVRNINEVAEEWGADLIVVGSHGHGFLGRVTLGSVSDGLVHHAKCPVLVVRGAH